MTYPPGSPGNSGYPPGSFGAPTPAYGQPVADPGPSKLPLYLNIAIVLLGIAAYVAAFGPVMTITTNVGPFSLEASQTGGILLTLGAVLAALLAAIGLLPKTKEYPTVIALLAVLGLLAVIEQIVNKSPQATIGWALWLVLAFVLIQAILAVVVLLFDTGVLTPPAPKPRYEAAPYGSYGSYGSYGGPAAPGGYYGQTAPQPPVAPQPPQPPLQRPGYPSQYGAYQPGPAGPSYGDIGQPPGASNQGPPTPPTGFPIFSPPPAVGSGQHQAPSGPAPTPTPSPQPSAPTSDPTTGPSSTT